MKERITEVQLHFLPPGWPTVYFFRQGRVGTRVKPHRRVHYFSLHRLVRICNSSGRIVAKTVGWTWHRGET